MCGIAGILHWNTVNDAPRRVERMVTAMRHRGPDGRGDWQTRDVALGHARLSILDLAGGVQPMTNEDGRVVVVFNGEIYNHRPLREELAARGHDFKSDHSDTEVLVHGYEEWGAGLTARLNGMFALAIWDARTCSLFLARDRYGIKPLYLARDPKGCLIFASEVRSILAAGLIAKKASSAALLEYFSLQNLVGEETLFEGIRQLPAGHWQMERHGRVERRQYWDLRFPRSSRQSLADSAQVHRDILYRAVERQLDADVPVMTYLSGGIDSSAITASAYALHRTPRAYSCIFDLEGVGEDRMVDERQFSRAVARQLGIPHVELELPQDSLSRCIDKVIASLEYPRMGMSYVNYLIAERVGRDAKVVLSGTGGDELHGGYLYRYQNMPAPDLAPIPLWRRLARWLRGRPESDAAAVIRRLLNFPVTESGLQATFTSGFLADAEGCSPRRRISALIDACPSDHPWDMLMYVDAKAYLHGLLVLEDKLSMAHSLEARVPLLDNELVDFVLDQPWSHLCDGQIGKIVFRESVRPIVPAEIYQKPKMGFGPPDASWYRSTLRGWISGQLSEEKIRARGVFQPEFVRGVLEAHFSGARNHVALIWSLLSFESWCRVFGMYGGDLGATIAEPVAA